MNFKSPLLAFISGIALTLLTASALYVGKSTASTTVSGISGLYGCAMRDDKWGIAPVAGRTYDVSGLVWVLDATNKKISGIDLRYRFESSPIRIEREDAVFYKDEPISLEPTEIQGIFKFSFSDEDEDIYITATNSGNTLLLAGVGSTNHIAEVGLCQKM